MEFAYPPPGGGDDSYDPANVGVFLLSAGKPTFLNRSAELARLQSLLHQRKSLLLWGPAGIGKSALLAELRERHRDEQVELLFSSATTDPASWLRHVLLELVCGSPPAGFLPRLGLSPQPGRDEVRTLLARKSAGAVRTLLAEALGEGRYAIVMDPLGFVSQACYRALRELERTGTPLVLAARSPHMEEIGYATKFAWPRQQRLALGPLPSGEMEQLLDCELAGWPRHPANEEAFRAHVLAYAAGNPGTLLELLAMVRAPAYWSGTSIKMHLLTVDFNLRGPRATLSRP
jgi:hypothetical protein